MKLARFSNLLTWLVVGLLATACGSVWLAFTLNDSTGVVTLREDPTPELDRVPNYALGEDHPGACYLQPKDKR